MRLNEMRQHLDGRMGNPRRRSPSKARRPKARPGVECLEVRCVPATFTAATTADLIADIHAANALGGANTINLTAATYAITSPDNTTDGSNGLPVIANGDQLTIDGNAADISGPGLQPANNFRLFDVAERRLADPERSHPEGRRCLRRRQGGGRRGDLRPG